MRITIFTAGSQGDVQPCIMLGKGLQKAGFDVLLTAPQNFANLIQKNNLCFHPLRGDVQQIMSGETGRRCMEPSRWLKML
jgi:UDP:flavonoid glycosyltransferase YjiC (YdhE family)